MLFFSAPSAKSLPLSFFTMTSSPSTLVYSARTGGNVRAMPSGMSTFEFQPNCVCAALQSHGPTGVSDFTRYGVSGTDRFNSFPNNSTPQPANSKNQIGTYD